jgi:hypothetical protein
MEAGIKSACQIQTHVESVEKTVHVTSVLDNLKVNGSLLLDLCLQGINLSEIAQYTYVRSEQLLVNNLLKSILSHIKIIHSTLANTYNKTYTNTTIVDTETLIYGLETEESIQQYVSLLWEKLKFSYSQQLRSLLLKIIIIIKTISYLFHSLLLSSPKYLLTYNEPHKTSSPSFKSQVINPTPSSLVIDPFITSLQQNYYYPLTTEMPIDEMEYNINEESNQITQAPPKSPIKKVETSIDTISDFLQEMEGDDPLLNLNSPSQKS